MCFTLRGQPNQPGFFPLRIFARGQISETSIYRCARATICTSLCRGVAAHDEMTAWAVELLMAAFRQFPQAGFAYSDWALADEQRTPLTYGDEFAFGCGAYYDEAYAGQLKLGA